MVNGNGKWQVGFWVMTVLVIGSFTWTSISAMFIFKKVECNTDRYFSLKETANDCLHKIDLRLSRIEDKLKITE